MLPWLLQLIGVRSEIVQHLDQAALAFQYPWILGVGLAALVPLGWFIVVRQRRNLATVSPGLRSALSGLRIGILALMVVVLAGPYLMLDLQTERRPIVALLLDQSQSMQLQAGPFDQEAELVRIARATGAPLRDGRVEPATRQSLNRTTRAKLAKEILDRSPAFFEPLARRFELRLYTFDREVRPAALDPAQPVLPEGSEPGSATYLGDALAKVLQDAGERPIAGVVLVTDGQNTGGRSPGEAAAALRAAGAPLYPVPVGSSSPLKDVAVVDVSTAGLIAVGDTARVAVTVQSQGFDGRPVAVELREGEKLLDRKELVLRGSEQQQVELTFQATEPGGRYLTVQVPPLPEEPDYLRGNNSDVAFVRVSAEKLKVLYLEGPPRWDFRFLKNALRRDHGLAGRAEGAPPDVVVETEWRRLPAEQQAAALPRTLDEFAAYHTVIVGDVSPQLLTPARVELLARAVREKGVGLVVAAGPQAMPHAYPAALQDLLPVKLRRQAAGMEAPIYKPFRLELSPEGAAHEAMRLFDDPGRNQNAWERLPAYYWCAAAERPAPAAAVLAWNPSVAGAYGKLPLIAHHFAGQGKVLFVGTDATWLWRQNVGDRFFYQFWGQGLRFVSRRDEQGGKKSWLEVHPLRAQPQESATVEVRAFTADGAPRTDPAIAVQVCGGGKAETITLAADPAVKGRYAGKYALGKEPGEYRFSYAAETGPVEGRVRVLAATEELRQPAVNRAALEQLASAGGGRVVELPDLAVIPDKLQGETKLKQDHREATLWDNWLALGLIVLLYSVDVGLRRLAGLS